MPDRPSTVFLVDDDPAVRESLSLLLESEGYRVEVHPDAAGFLAACGPGLYGCVVTDLSMPGMDGIALQAEMARRGLQLPIVFLTGHGSIPTSVKAIKAGAVDFLTKPVSGSRLLQGVAAALALCERRQGEAERNSNAVSAIAELTDREREVMALVVKGLANKEIARSLGISHRTVEIHKAHVMRKTGAQNLIDLVQIHEAATGSH